MQCNLGNIYSTDGRFLTADLDSKTLTELGIRSGDKLRVRSTASMKIFVRLMMKNENAVSEQDPKIIPGNTFEVFIPPENTVGELK